MKNMKDYVGAIFLIFIGSIFLLNTSGLLEWNIWFYILRFWPVFLILSGLRFILGNSLASIISISIVASLTFLLIGSCAYTGSTESDIPFLKGLTPICNNISTDISEEIEKSYEVRISDYKDLEGINYDLNLGVLEFSITDTSDEYMTLDAKFNSRYGEPKITEDLEDGVLDIMVEEGSNHVNFTNFKAPEYDINLGGDILSSLRIDNGVGSGTIDLSETIHQDIDISSGTGKINMTLGTKSIPETLTLDIGTGNITLNIPSDVGFELSYDLGVGSISIDNDNLASIGGNEESLKSSNFDDATKTFVIVANVGVGSLKINFITL